MSKISRILFTTVFSLLITLTSVSAQATWEFIGELDRDAYYLDPDILDQDPRPRAWTLIDLHRPIPFGDDKVYSVRERYELNCDRSTLRRLRLDGYAERMGAGEVLTSRHEPGDWHSVPPHSPLAGLFSWLCGQS